MHLDKQNTDKQWMKRMLSHNVRMPMAVVTGYGNLLQNGLLSEEEQKEAVQTICENITYMNDALQVVLEENAEQREGDEEPDESVQVLDLVHVLRRVEMFVGEISRRSGIPISVRSDKPQMFVRANYFALMRVFYQIFENAFKYLEFGNSVQIQLFDAGEDILIIYKDNGNGLPVKEKKSLFEKGFRGSNGKGKKGSGYGLHDLQRVVHRMGGTVKISQEKGNGFSIYMTLPACKEISETDSIMYIGQ